MSEEVKFLEVKTLADLAGVLNIKIGTLNYYLNKGIDLKCYKSFVINKKDGGVRLIESPVIQLRYIQKMLKNIWTSVICLKFRHMVMSVKGQSILMQIHMQTRLLF